MNTQILARAIATELFNLGSEGDNRCQRIEFKGGTHGKETSNGGLAFEPLCKVVEKALRENKTP